jgi:NADPH:quinone reductase-like Zn-dependent oxidoreductase
MSAESRSDRTMQAVHITRHGGPEVLEVVDIPVPEPGPGEVRVRVLGVSVNHLDLWVRRGMPGFPVPFPRVPGCDGTGVVDALGEGVAGPVVGTQVLLEPGFTLADGPEVARGEDHLAEDYGIRGEHSDGFAQEYVVLPQRFVRPLPAGLDPVLAAAAPLVFLTAWGLLHARAAIRPGEHVLVLGATSGVGSAAIQMARAHGCRVWTTASTEEGRALGVELGAEAALDHRDPDWPRALRKLTEGRGADVVVEHIGPATWAASMRALARNGRLVTCGGTTGPTVEVLLPHLFIKNQSILGSTMGPRDAFGPILEGLARGTWRAVVDRVMPLSEVREAHRLLEAREVRGKLVLVPGR